MLCLDLALLYSGSDLEVICFPLCLFISCMTPVIVFFISKTNIQPRLLAIISIIFLFYLKQ